MKHDITQSQSGNLSRLFFLMFLALVWTQCLQASQEPDITITDPVSDIVDTREASIDMAGALSYDAAVAEITWWTDQGAEGKTRTTTQWNRTMQWSAEDVPLVSGENHITVMVHDAEGNADEETIIVTRNLPDGEIIPKKTKITTWFLEDYTDLDRLTFSGKLGVGSPEIFSLPFDEEVSVNVSVIHPGSPLAQPLFNYSIPAGTVAVSEKIYRYRREGSENSGSGLYKLEIKPPNAEGLSIFYLYANNENWFWEKKALMSDTEFKQFVREMEAYTISVRIGDKIWEGQVGPLYASAYERKVQSTWP